MGDLCEINFTTKNLKKNIKEPWAMTRKEWNQNTRFYRSGKIKTAKLPTGERVLLRQVSTAENYLEANDDFLDMLRRVEIVQALLNGKPVPLEILIDYPDLITINLEVA